MITIFLYASWFWFFLLCTMRLFRNGMAFKREILVACVYIIALFAFLSKRWLIEIVCDMLALIRAYIHCFPYNNNKILRRYSKMPFSLKCIRIIIIINVVRLSLERDFSYLIFSQFSNINNNRKNALKQTSS